MPNKRSRSSRRFQEHEISHILRVTSKVSSLPVPESYQPFTKFKEVTKRVGFPSIRIVLALSLVALGVGPCFGQAVNATLTGTVTDASGAGIPAALVVVTNTNTGVDSKTASDAAGQYLFTTLAPGGYTLRVQKEGFQTAVVSGLMLQVYQKATRDVALQVGQASVTVDVKGAAPLVDATTASLGTVIGSEAIESLPLNLRQVTALALVVPGTQDTTGRSLTSFTGNGSGFNDNSYSGSGGRSSGNQLLIDGMTSRALNNGSFALSPPPEMVQEFKIQNNVYDAAFGGASGVFVNLVTNSGSNGLHGSGWEFLRNRVLDAKSYNFNPGPAPEKPEYIRNQFGTAVGGPIVKNKLFFFGSYEGLRLIQGSTGGANVPSDPQRSGDFSSLLTGTTENLCGTGGPPNLVYDSGQLFDPATESNFVCPNNGNAILVGTPIPNNDLAAYKGGVQNLDPVGQKFLALYPHQNSVGLGGIPQFINTIPFRRNDDQVLGRVDWTKSEKDRFFFRYLVGNTNQAFQGAFPGFAQKQHFRGHNLVGTWTRFFTPSLINDVRVGYQKDLLVYACSACPRPAGTIAGFGVNNLTAVRPDLEEIPNVTLQNFGIVGDGFPGYFPIVVPDSILKFEDTLTWVHGRHTLTLGGDFNLWKTEGVQDPFSVNGSFAFNGQYSSLNGLSSNASTAADLADLELGFPNYATYTKNPIVTNLVEGGWYSLFANDSFRVNKRLTIEGGLRWEYRRLPVDSRNQISAFYPVAKDFQPGDGLLLTPLPDAENDALCSDPYYVSVVTNQCLIMSSAERRSRGFTGRKLRQLSYGSRHGDFAPRIGLSWRPMDSDRLIFHVGAGIFQDLSATNAMGSFSNNNPVFTRTILFQGFAGSPPPETTQNVFNNASAVPLSDTTSQLMPSPFYHTATTYRWSASIQSQLSSTVGLEVGYVGSRGNHLETLHFNGNQPRPGGGRPWPDFGTLNYIEFNGNSNYDALTVKVNRRLSQGLSGLVAYTFSKSLDYNGGDSDFTSFPQDDNNQKAEYGVSDFNIKHRLVVSGTYELPFGKGRAFLNSNAWSDAVLGGWALSPIITFQTGLPFTVLSINDFSGTGSLSPRPDRLCNGSGHSTEAAPGSPKTWFDLSCFGTTPPPAPRFGTSGRNILTGPNLFSTDLSLAKRFKPTDRFNLDVRADFFNLFNHPNLGLPNATVGSQGAGIITSASAMREIQLGLKLMF